jgi:acetyl esterase/lipase
LNKNQPRALIISAKLDPFVVDDRDYYQRLRKAKIQSEQHVVPGVIHSFFDNNPSTIGFREGAAQVIKFFKIF